MNEIVPYITATAAIIGMLIALAAAWQAAKGRAAAEDAKAGVIIVDGKIFKLDERVDGRLSQLLAANELKATAAADLARSEGHAAGEQAQRDRSSPETK